MFRGATSLTLDAKGRLAVPSKYRDEVMSSCSGKLILTAHPHGCLLLYPEPAWLPVEEKLNALPSFDLRAAAWKRMMAGYATDLDLDGQGRFLVPPELREIARLDKQVMLVGQYSHFEIWSAEGWRAQIERALVVDESALPPALEGFTL